MTFSEVVDGIKPVGTLSQRLSSRQRCVCVHMVTCIFLKFVHLSVCPFVVLTVFYSENAFQAVKIVSQNE